MHRNDVHTGADLDSYREHKGLTRKDFASLIGITQATLLKWTRKGNLRVHRPWLPTLLLGVEHRLNDRQTTRRGRERMRTARRLAERIPRRAALQQLPPRIAHLFDEDEM